MPDTHSASPTTGEVYEGLEEATGENTTSGALDHAAETYLQLVGGSPVVPGVQEGALEELLREAQEQESLDAAVIASIVAKHDLPVKFDPADWTIGPTVE